MKIIDWHSRWATERGYRKLFLQQVIYLIAIRSLEEDKQTSELPCEQVDAGFMRKPPRQASGQRSPLDAALPIHYPGRL